MVLHDIAVFSSLAMLKSCETITTLSAFRTPIHSYVPLNHLSAIQDTVYPTRIEIVVGFYRRLYVYSFVLCIIDESNNVWFWWYKHCFFNVFRMLHEILDKL